MQHLVVLIMEILIAFDIMLAILRNVYLSIYGVPIQGVTVIFGVKAIYSVIV